MEIKPLSYYQRLVVSQKHNLDMEISTLDRFMNCKITRPASDAEYEIMVHQMAVMLDYSDVLQSRINLYGDTSMTEVTQPKELQ